MLLVDPKAAEKIREGAVGVLPTDTLYGLVGSALIPAVVGRIYTLKKRDPIKPFIVLIADEKDLSLFNIVGIDTESLKKHWPGPVSILFQCPEERFKYLHRGTGEIAFRLPADEKLCEFLRLSGPIVAPSANVEGQEPVKTIEEARAFFGDGVDFYVDGGTLTGLPSTLMRFVNGKAEILRQGRA